MNFSDLNVGDALPTFTTEPINRTTLALYCGASGDHNPIHVDIDFAKQAGMPDVFVHGMLPMAYLGKLLTNWAPQRSIRQFSVRFAAVTHLHEKVVCTGRIVEKDEANKSVLIAITTSNQQGEIKLTGKASISLAD